MEVALIRHEIRVWLTESKWYRKSIEERSDRVLRFHRRPGRVEAMRGGFGEVASVLHVGLHYRAVDRTVPAVIAERAQIGLVHRRAGEQRRQAIARQHVHDRVRL